MINNFIPRAALVLGILAASTVPAGVAHSHDVPSPEVQKASAVRFAAPKAGLAGGWAAPRYPDGFRGRSLTGADPRHRATRKLAATTRSSAEEPKLTIDVTDRNGKLPATDDAPAASLIALDGSAWLSADLQDGHAEGRLPQGRYAVLAWVTTRNGDSTSTSLVYLPDVAIETDTRLQLDARKARPLTPGLDRADARIRSASAFVSQKIGGEVTTIAMLMGTDLYVTPTDPAAGLALRSQAVLTKNGAEYDSPYVYNIAHEQTGRVGDTPRTVATKDLAAVRMRYGSEGGTACGFSHSGVNWGIGGQIGEPVGVGALPTNRTEYFTPGVTWATDVVIGEAGCGFEEADIRTREERFPRAGTYARDWNVGPFGLASGTAIWGTHEGGEPALAVPMLSTWNTRSQIAPYVGTTGTSTLRNAAGEVVYTSDQPGTAHKWPAPPLGAYTLTLEANRTVPWSDLTTRQRAVIRFMVTDSAPRPLPAISYRTPLDARSRAQAGALQPITLAPTGSAAAPTLRVSYDDGRSWTGVPVRKSGAGWIADVRNPASGHVSLNAAVPGVIDHTLIRAYGIR
ncbi:hypothetical protein [Actinomadura sp. 6N118]|uniref:hypothetical protein n=1 Tax=Actinomadura sp. 6N118 TaxID=3375151 RepID=UPI00378B95A1